MQIGQTEPKQSFGVVIGETNYIRLILAKFECFQIVGFVGRQPNFNLRIKIITNFSVYKVEEFKKR